MRSMEKSHRTAHLPAAPGSQEHPCIALANTLYYSALKYGIDKNKESLRVYIERLKGLSPLDKLSLGYAFVTDMEYNRINSVSELKRQEKILLSFSDGRVLAKVESIEKAEGGSNG